VKKIPQPVTTSEKVVVEAAPVKIVSAVSNQGENKTMGGKYPRRENRKLPSHLVDALIPDLYANPPKKSSTHGRYTTIDILDDVLLINHLHFFL